MKGDEYQEIFGVDPRMFVIPEMKVSPQAIWIGGNLETTGLTLRSGSILGIAMVRAITKVWKSTRMLTHSKFPPETFFARKQLGVPRNFKQFRNKMQSIKSKYGLRK